MRTIPPLARCRVRTSMVAPDGLRRMYRFVDWHAHL
ncbi:MAG: hypothetical protein IPJ18_22280 [Betaproteobacteria bacterium]|nr:hypothetical protein [Betaproteobacteria bacterium]